jgi:amino acid adenylation domain-containing protein/FkbM family methyltransferase
VSNLFHQNRTQRSPKQQIVAGLIAEVLELNGDVSDVGFVAMGGNPLLARQLVKRLRAAFDVDITVEEVLESTTVADLTSRLVPAGSTASPIEPSSSRPSNFPMSCVQQRLWFLFKLEGLRPTYNIPMALRLEGVLHPVALQSALEDLALRHEILRTVLKEVDGIAQQVVLPPKPGRPVLEQIFVSEEDLPKATSHASNYSFDLAREHPVRAYVFSVNESSHVLLLVLHHVACDGWSFAPLIRDLSAAYIERCRGLTPNWKPLPAQYAEYCLRQRDWLEEKSDPNSAVGRQIAFWKQKLHGVPEQLTLPIDRVRTRMTHRGDHVPFWIDAIMHRKLLRLAKDSGSSLYMVLHAALCVLLWRLGAGRDIPIGCNVAGRTQDAYDELIGCFINTIVLRTEIAGNPNFRGLLSQVRDADLEAYENQELPFDHLVEILNPSRSLAHNPLYQVVLALETISESPLRFGDLAARGQSVGFVSARFDLVFSFTERRQQGAAAGLEASLIFACDLFDTETAQTIADRLVRILSRVADDPDIPIGFIDVLSPAERTLILNDWNDTARLMPATFVSDLIQERVARSPHRTALAYEDELISFAELNLRANQVAHFLIGMGIGPEQLVAIALPRSPRLVVSLLGVLKAGAAYLPLDPEYPSERLTLMLNDSQPACLITDSHISELLPRTIRHVVLNSNEFETTISRQNTANPTDQQRTQCLRPQHPAYVIYTSGSTGKPKGVVIQHSALVNYLSWASTTIYENSEGGSPTVHSISFDGGVTTLFGSLVAGQCLTILRSGGEVEALVSSQADSEYALVKLTPSHLSMINHNLRSSGHKVATRALMLGGEALIPDDVELWRKRFPQVRLINHFGPTETTVGSCTYEIGTTWLCSNRVPIGLPIWNTQVYVLDDLLQLCAPGVPGELYIGGFGLARGYLSQPGLSSERFVANPFDRAGSRLYRTGDQVRWYNGQLEFLGRADQQIKIRGFRIEPAEIEATLRSHPSVAAAIVIGREDASGQRNLVAHIVARAGHDLDKHAIRRFLSERLPAYMVPAAWVQLAEVPLTRNGKVDMKALPMPEFESAATRLPRTPQEELLVQLFCEVLGRGHVGVDDNFFHLGGHSLLATRLVSRIRSSMSIEVPIRALFEAPTVAALASRLQGAGISRKSLRPVPRPQCLPLSSGQQRLWFLHHFEGSSSDYNLPLPLHLQGVLNVSAVAEALGDVLARHESLRTIFPDISGRPEQLVLEPSAANLKFEYAKIPSRSLVPAMERASAYCFDLTTEISIRAWLWSTDDGRDILLLVMHHISTDALSLAPLTRDFVTAYLARCNGREPLWSRLSVQYADYTLWQLELLGHQDEPDSTISRQIAFWKKTLDGLTEQLDLPTDRPRPAVASHRGAAASLSISADLHHALLLLARKEQTTLFMVLQTAIVALMVRLGAGTDIAIGTSIAGRTDDALDDLVGFFVNLLVLRTDGSGNPSFRQLLARVRAVDLAAYANQDLPFERLVEVINPARSLARHPLFQVALVFANAAAIRANVDGATEIGVAIPLDMKLAKFDLQFQFSESYAADGTSQEMIGSIEYATDLFDQGTVDALGRRLVSVLEAMANDATQTIGSVNILSPIELRDSLWLRNDTDRALPQLSVPELFTEQAMRTPEAMAIVEDGSSLSYRDVDSLANKIAQHLRSLGVGLETPVGIAASPSTKTIVALLAILKAGGTYVPLDPEYPADRLAFMLKDSRVSVIVGTEESLSRLPSQALNRVRVVDLDADWARINRLSPTLPPVHREPSQLAYIIYTSGSTGQPKGVGVVDYAIVRLIRNTNYISLHDEIVPRIAQVSSLSFDAATFEIWGSLLNGGSLHLVDKAIFLDQQRFARYIADIGIDTLFITTALFNLYASNQQGAFQNLRYLLFGGERCDVEAVRSILSKDSPSTLLHVYGPTEGTTFSSYHEVQPPAIDATTIPIGAPISNTTLYVLDEWLNIVPSNVAGELYIGGGGLARGYLHQPRLTAERFIANPFCIGKGQRLYRTGDRVRRLSTGELEFLGRTDRQLKLRGFRVEPAEIESQIKRFPQIVEAVVSAREHAGQMTLAAYFVAQDNIPLSDQLRRHLHQQLPEHMMPAFLVQLPRLPLTVNGKVDYLRLPLPDDTSMEVDNQYCAPDTAEECCLLGIWREVLGVELIGTQSNFFSLGGDSLRAIRVKAMARDRGLLFELHDLFEHQTITELARRVRHAVGIGQSVVLPFELVAAEDRVRLPAGIDDAYPLSKMQLGMLFHSGYDTASTLYHCVMRAQLNHVYKQGAMHIALAELVSKHEILRTSVDMHSFSEPLQVVHARGDIPIVVTDLRHLSTAGQLEYLKSWVSEEIKRPFVVSKAPLLRVHLHLTAENRFEVLLSFHHAILDGWSDAALLTELLQIYEGLLQNRRATAAALSVKIRDFIALERAALQSVESKEFWSKILEGASPTRVPARSKLHAACAEDMERAYLFKQELIPLSPPLVELIGAVSRRLGVPLKSVLLAAHLRALAVLSGADDVVSGIVCNGRPEQLDGDKVLGLFLNTIPLRLTTRASESWTTLIHRTLRAEGDCFPHRRFPLAEIMRGTGFGGRLAVLFNFTHFHIYDGLGASKDRITVAGVAGDTSFDLVVNFSVAGTALVGSISGPGNIYEQDELCRYSQCYARILEAMVSDVSQPVGRMDLLTVGERQQCLVEWNATEQLVVSQTLPELFECQVRRTPQAIAVVFGDLTLNYDQLNTRANQLAHHLISQGIGPDHIVAVALPRSLDLPMALLGILKAGAAYLPLDPDYPPERLALMIEDARPVLTFVTPETAVLLPPGTVTLCLQEHTWRDSLAERALLDPRNADRVQPLWPLNSAYLIYTSGSTGRPKGVLTSHGSIVNRLQWMQAAYSLDSTDRVLQKTPTSFDVSVWEFFWPLLEGARLVLAEPQRHKDTAYLARLIQTQGITTAHFVPSMLRSFVQEPAAQDCRSLQRIICSGEALPKDLQAQLHALLDSTQLHNLYGPTEAAVDVTAWRCRPEDSFPSVPIGRPIWNTQIYILDPALQPALPGVAGELYIAGAGLARGYLSRPALSCERFIANPFGPAGSRLYRTGDLAKWSPQGVLEYLGRNDQQVKIRGFRIEPGEIEAHLADFAGVDDAIVVVREDMPGDRRLVSYVVPAFSHALPIRKLLQLRNAGTATKDDLTFELPNGSTIFHQNPSETRFLYEEIFSDQVYLKHGVTLRDEDCVVDVGANIGLFSLFVRQHFPNASLYSFEPLPPVFRSLQLNAALYDSKWKVFECGLADAARQETFTFYPHNTIISSSSVTTQEARGVLRSFMLNQEQKSGTTFSVESIEAMLDARMTTQQYDCQLRTLSDILAENQIARIDLLKIDVENAEEEVLAGIRDHDWPKIQQLVVEIHDLSGRLKRVQSLLQSKGFTVHCEQETLLRRTHIYNLYAVRTPRPRIADAINAGPRAAAWTWKNESSLVRDLRTHLLGRLPEYMVPSTFVLMHALPTTPNGKLERGKLPIPVQNALIAAHTHTPPQTQEQQAIAKIWQEVLGVESIGIHDDFFELGGDSIRAMLAITKMNRALSCGVPISALFSSPTIEAIAQHLGDHPTVTFQSQLIRLRFAGPGTPQLFLIPPGSGDCLCYRELVASITGDISITGLERAELTQRALARPTSIRDIAAGYREAIKTIQAVGPYHLLGWSLGGVIAFELATQLEADGDTSVFIIDSQLPSSNTCPQWVSQLAAIVDNTQSSDHAALLEEWESRPEVAEHLDSLMMLSPEHTHSLDEQVKVYRRLQLIHALAAFGYQPSETLSHLYYISASDTNKTLAEPLGPSQFRTIARERFEFVTVTADHHSILKSPAAENVVKYIDETLRVGACIQ